jgi:hypothetical protein
MGVFRTKFVTENVEQHRERESNIEQHGERERERERLKTLPYTLNLPKNHRCFAGECIDSREPEGSVSNFYERRDRKCPRANQIFNIYR